MNGECTTSSASAITGKNPLLFVETFLESFLPPPGASGTMFFRNLT